MAKSKPIGVRFDLEKLELIKKEQRLDTPQAVLNYLMDNYQAKAPAGHKEKKLAPAPAKKEKIPPPGLKGIDLAIWKAENETKK